MPSVSRGRSKTPTQRTQPTAVRAASPSSVQQKRRKQSAQRKNTVSPTPTKKKSSSSRSPSTPPARRSSTKSPAPGGSRRSSSKLLSAAAAAAASGEEGDFAFGVRVDRTKTFTHAATSHVPRKPLLRRALGSLSVECAYMLFEPWEQGLTLLLYAIVLWPLVWGFWRVAFLALQAVGIDEAVNEGVKQMSAS
jgi:hypothetical protein